MNLKRSGILWAAMTVVAVPFANIQAPSDLLYVAIAGLAMTTGALFGWYGAGNQR